MNRDWWPAPLAHISREDPWGFDAVTVAEVVSFDDHPFAGHRQTTTALIPLGQVDAIRKSLADFEHVVSTSGPHPTYESGRPFKPAFWISYGKHPEVKRYEPLILQWRSHHSTVLQPDPGFLMTYGLVPRPGKDGIVHWDDPRTPRGG